MLNVEDLVVKVGLFQLETDSHLMGQQGSLADFWLVQRALAVSLVLREFDHAVLKLVIDVDADFTHHDD